MLDEATRAACLAKLQEEARTDYLVNLLLPAYMRDAHLSLRAFHAEIAAIPFRVREAIAGQIRLQWWREVLTRERDVEARTNPAAAAILAYVDAVPDATATLATKLDAHESDLYGDPPPDMNALEGYAGETRSILYQLLVRSSETDPDVAVDASGHAGVAEYMAETLANWPAMREQERGVVPRSLVGDGGHGDEALVRRWAETCARHAHEARKALPGELRGGAYRSLGLFAAIAAHGMRRPAKVASAGVPLSPLRRQWLVWRGP